MIPRGQSQHILPDQLILIRIHIIDPRDMQSHAREEGFPPSDRVRADHWMDRGEIHAVVQRGAARGGDFVAAGFGGGFEDGLGAGGGEGFEEGLEGRGEAVVTLLGVSLRKG